MLQKKLIVETVQLLNNGASYREIQAILGIGNSTISRIKKTAEALDLTFKKVESMSDSEVDQIFNPKVCRRDYSKVMPDFEAVYQRRGSRTSRLPLIDEWYIYSQTFGREKAYSYSQYKHYFQIWLRENHPEDIAVMTVFREPGRYLYIDWVGDQPFLVRDPHNPEKTVKVHILVTTLGYSSLTWFEAYPQETKEFVALGINRALEFYGAVPYALRPDNMRTAVTAHTKKKLVFSKMLEDLAHHYNMEIHPCQPRKPKGKASVERAVRIIEEKFLNPLNGFVFDSFEELNKKAAQFCDQLNGRRKAGETMSRLELYNQYDLPAMNPLPLTKFSLYEYSEKKVPVNYHVYFDNHYYSVPYTFIGKKVTVKATIEEIVICDETNQIIARHKRSWLSTGPNHTHITAKEHMPDSHQAALEEMDDPKQSILDKARGIGPYTEKLIHEVLQLPVFEQQSYKQCHAILRKAKKTKSGQLEEAARICLETDQISADAFESVLKNCSMEKADVCSLPAHANIRGKDEYS